MTIKHVVFDMGHILLHYDPELPFKRIIPDEAKRGFFFAKVCTTAWNEEQDKGRPWEEAEALAIAEFPGWETEIRAFRENWHEMVPYIAQDIGFDNLENRGVDKPNGPIFGTTDWTERTIVMDVPQSATQLSIGGPVGKFSC